MKNSKKIELIEKFVDSIDNLCRVNVLTGAWDYRRNSFRKWFDGEVNGNNYLKSFNDNWDDFRVREKFYHKFIETERKSRFFVEQRAVYRTEIDEILEKLVKL